MFIVTVVNFCEQFISFIMESFVKVTNYQLNLLMQ